MPSSQTTTISNGQFDIYVSVSPGAGKKPALIICSEAFGVNSHMRSVADRFAEKGFAVFVPELFWRIERHVALPYDEAGLKRASELADAYDKQKGVDDMAKVVSFVRGRNDVTGKIGILGFCVGGAAAYLAAARLGLDACVSYYGKGIEDYLGDAATLTCPTVLHYGGSDRFIPPATIAKVREGLKGCPDVEIYDYPGVDHGFNSEDRRAYNADVARLAMTRTMAALDRGLRS